MLSAVVKYCDLNKPKFDLDFRIELFSSVKVVDSFEYVVATVVSPQE